MSFERLPDGVGGGEIDFVLLFGAQFKERVGLLPGDQLVEGMAEPSIGVSGQRRQRHDGVVVGSRPKPDRAVAAGAEEEYGEQEPGSAVGGRGSDGECVVVDVDAVRRADEQGLGWPAGTGSGPS